MLMMEDDGRICHRFLSELVSQRVHEATGMFDMQVASLTLRLFRPDGVPCLPLDTISATPAGHDCFEPPDKISSKCSVYDRSFGTDHDAVLPS